MPVTLGTSGFLQTFLFALSTIPSIATEIQDQLHASHIITPLVSLPPAPQRHLKNESSQTQTWVHLRCHCSTPVWRTVPKKIVRLFLTLQAATARTDYLFEGDATDEDLPDLVEAPEDE
ncbi:hypothetical protein C8J56DRAFT_1063657 [Mycena floridula]|nr:hypothetical protein C8J56DRAFT_1063657 [Mycena floridula]